MSEQLSLAGFPAAAPQASRDHLGRFRRVNDAVPLSAEVASVERGEFLQPILFHQYPNLSSIIRFKTRGEGLRFYDTMLGTDSDLAGFFQDLIDDVLHYPWNIRAAGDSVAQREQADFIDFALHQIPHFQNAMRHFLDSHARGFSVTEKMYRVVDRGQWAGAVIYDQLYDRPARWFNFHIDRSLLLRTLQNYYPGEPVPQDKFVVVTFGSNSNPWGTPILDLCYLAWFLKHHALKNQAIFMEKWASPTPRAKYPWRGGEGVDAQKLNDASRHKALEVLQSIQHDNAIAYPEGMDISLLESARNGTISFESYIDQLTKTESRVITGQVLNSMGDQGGSYALGKVHEKREANKVEMLAMFASSQVRRTLVRDLIDRNFGPQDVYPEFQVLARDVLSKQAYLTVEEQALATGHKLSRSWSDKVLQVVSPTGPDDVLVPSVTVKPGQTLPVAANLAEASEDGLLTGDTT